MRQGLAGVAGLTLPLKLSIGDAAEMNKRLKMGSAIGDPNVDKWVLFNRRRVGIALTHGERGHC